MQAVLQTIPYTPGMKAFLDKLQDHEAADSIIISDSNSVFIDWILTAYGHQKVFKQVFTNPAKYSDEGLLLIEPCHGHSCTSCPVNMCKADILSTFLSSSVNTKADGSSSSDLKTSSSVSSLSAHNSIAASTSSSSISSSSRSADCRTTSTRQYAHIFYIGDGSNDFCPSALLEKADVLFVREGYALDKLLRKQEEQTAADAAATPSGLKAQVLRWSSGEDILAWINSNLGLLL